MPKSGFDLRPSKSTPGVSMSMTIPGGKNLKNYIKSYGDLTVSVDSSLPTTLDSDDLQYFYIPNLTVNAGKTLTASNRCAGMVIFTDNLNLQGKITMKGKGGKCKKSLHALQDLTLPDQIVVGLNSPDSQALSDKIKEGAFDLNTFLSKVGASFSVTPGSKVLVPKLGGAGGAQVTHNSTAVPGSPGSAGSTVGAGATGGGGGGAVWATSGNGWQTATGGKRGTVTGGGPAGAACGTNSASSLSATDPEDYNGAGGTPPPYGTNQGAGAGNPSGVSTGTATQPEEGVGGILIVVVFNSCTIGASGVLDATGSQGGGGNYGSGGSSGGGSVVLIYNQAGTYSNAGSLTAPGGASNPNGGAGGAGSTQILTFAQMGTTWS